MAPIERWPGTHNRRRAAWVVLGVLLAGLAVVLVLRLRTPPQMGPDDAVFRTVDALYTAVRNHDEPRLTQCARRLAAHRNEGKLPRDAADYLDGVITTARGGGWDPAARRLYDFMLAQRRDGAELRKK
jgi:hypothetical protein